MLEFKGRVVEISEMGTYQGAPYASLKLRTQTARGNEIVKFKLNVKVVTPEDIAEFLDEDVTVTCDLERGTNDLASLRVVKVE